MTSVARHVYPFTAIVGQEQMRLALLLHAVNPALGGVLVRGRKGTAKSTAVRALAALLPELACVQACPYGCDPHDVAAACDECAPRIVAGELLPVERRPVPVVELPIGATDDRVAGSLDLETAIQTGRRRFEPGLLARANRGILYMDEVNLLGDHLVDLLLDAAAMGRNYVEREGVSVSHPARVMLVGTMNPEEGELRPQLLDRFALAVEVEGLADPAERAEAVRNRIAFEAGPAGFAACQEPAREAERERLARARALLPEVELPASILDLIVHLCVAFEADGLRADLAMYRAAVSLAAYRGRLIVTEDDVRAVAPLVLAHRRRRQPFEQPGLDEDRLDQAIAEHRHQQSPSPASDTESNAGEERPPSNPADPSDPKGSQSPPLAPAAAGARGVGGVRGSAPDRWTAPATPPANLALPMTRKPLPFAGLGRRVASRGGQRGGAVRTAVPKGPVRELAVAATLSAAAPHQPARRASPNPQLLPYEGRGAWTEGGHADWGMGEAQSGEAPAVVVRREDLRERVRRGRSGSLLLFVVDASGSMGARERMAATKGAVLALLLDAYRKRDQVGVVTFHGSGAELVLTPTNSVDLAERRLTELRTGGRTPLAAGLQLGRAAIERALRGTRALEPVLLLVSDGRANSAPSGADPWQAARREAEAVRAAGWRTLVLDTERGSAGPGFARTVAGWLGAECLRLDAML